MSSSSSEIRASPIRVWELLAFQVAWAAYVGINVAIEQGLSPGSSGGGQVHEIWPVNWRWWTWTALHALPVGLLPIVARDLWLGPEARFHRSGRASIVLLALSSLLCVCEPLPGPEWVYYAGFGLHGLMRIVSLPLSLMNVHRVWSTRKAWSCLPLALNLALLIL